MKIKIVLLIGLLYANYGFAQTQKGNGILGGSLSLNYGQQTYPFTTLQSSPSTSKVTSWNPNLSITAGRFWTDNWLMGLTVSGLLTVTSRNLESNPNLTYSFTQLSVAATPFIRRYWELNSFYLFAGVGLSTTFANSKQPFFDMNGRLIELGRKESLITINPKLEVGINNFLTNRLAIQLIASTNALPIDVTNLSAGLVYWTGSGRSNNQPAERTIPQTDPGRWVLEGGFSVNSQKTNQLESPGNIGYQSNASNYTFSPSVGFFIKKNSLLGVTIPVSYAASKYETSITSISSSSDDKTWMIGISPYFQHYWTSTQFTPFTRINVGYLGYNSSSSNGNYMNGGLSIGFAYMAGERFIIESSFANASVSYQFADRAANQGNLRTWNAGVSMGLAGNFAIRYVLR